MSNIQLPQLSEESEKKFIKLTSEEFYQKEISFARQIVAKNKSIAGCDTNSILAAIMNVANVGLSLNPVLKLAYLVPRWNSSSKMMEAYLEPSYQGLVKLLTDTGSVSSVACYLVYKGDKFKATNFGIEHEMNPFEKRSNDDIVGVYAQSKLADGSLQFETMNIAELEEIRGRSESYKAKVAGKINSCIWDSDFAEMCRKTVIRRAVKYLPKSAKWDKLASAIELDEQDYAITASQEATIETLLVSANISPEQSQAIFRELPSMSSNHAMQTIKMLKDRQSEQIASGRGYGQGDILKKLENVQQMEQFERNGN